MKLWQVSVYRAYEASYGATLTLIVNKYGNIFKIKKNRRDIYIFKNNPIESNMFNLK